MLDQAYQRTESGLISILTGCVILTAAIVLSATLIIWLRPLLQRYALVRPNPRSSHREPTAQGGGIAVVIATIVIVVSCVVILPWHDAPSLVQFSLVLSATCVIAAVGAVDDLRGLSVGVRLPFQTLAVAILIIALPTESRIVPALPFWAERTLLVIGGVGFVNIVNFMDGIDWMTVAELVPVTLGIIVIGVVGGLPDHGTLVALAMLGAIVGFAPFNRPVAQLFLGDVGSLPLGLLLGWLLLLIAADGHLAAAIILPLYYLADATITLSRRLLAGERVWQAHRSHFYQRATDRGFSVLEIDTRVFATNVGLAALAVAAVLASTMLIDLAALLLASGLVTWLLVGFARGKS